MLTNFWSQSGVYLLLIAVKCWKALKSFFPTLCLFNERLLISLRARSSLHFHTSSTWDLSSSTTKSSAAESLGIWGKICSSGSSLTAVFARSNCITYLPPLVVFFSLRLNVTTSDLAAPSWACKVTAASQLGMWNEDSSYSTSLHITGLQKILTLRLGNDLPSFADAESGFTVVSVCFFLDFFFLWGTRSVKIAVRWSHDGCGVQRVAFQQERTWENSRKWCTEKSDVRWVISKVLYIRRLSVWPLCPVPFLWSRHPFSPLLMHSPLHTHKWLRLWRSMTVSWKTLQRSVRCLCVCACLWKSWAYHLVKEYSVRNYALPALSPSRFLPLSSFF